MAVDEARWLRRILVLLVAAAVAGTCAASIPRDSAPAWASPGLIGSGGWPFARQAVDPETAEGAAYIPGSSVLVRSDGRAELIPIGSSVAVVLPRDAPRVTEAVQADRSWLATGSVPGADAAERAVSARTLLDLRLLTQPSGASTASWYGAWDYVWPRDGAFAAAAFAATGHAAEAQRILSFLARVQSKSGLWAARYRPDGTAVTDGRPVQLDSLGWVLWATWFLRAENPSADLGGLWRMVRGAADQAARSLRRNGLPPPSPDYWERSPSTEQAPKLPTLGVCAPLLAGLRAAAALASERGDASSAQRWGGAARRLGTAIDRYFAPYGYPRSPIKEGGLDASITFLAPPFAAADPVVIGAVARNAGRLRLPGGGVSPGERFGGGDVAWTPETALFALAAAASGDRAAAGDWLGWLTAHRTTLGAFPEKVDDVGRQAGVAPLGWTSSLVMLAYAAERGPLPSPPS